MLFISSATYKYKPEGLGLSKTVSGITTAHPFRYCGEYYDKETGSYYLRTRYYNPRIGRFITEDTIHSVSNKMPNGQELVDPLSLNLYTYCSNNPVMYMDPSGHIAGIDDAVVVLVLVSATIVTATAAWLSSPDGQKST